VNSGKLSPITSAKLVRHGAVHLTLIRLVAHFSLQTRKKTLSEILVLPLPCRLSSDEPADPSRRCSNKFCICAIERCFGRNRASQSTIRNPARKVGFSARDTVCNRQSKM